MAVKIIRKGNSTGNTSEIKKPVMKPPTLRQQGVIAEVGKGRQSKAQIIRKMGYKESIARNPKKVFDSPVVAQEVDKVLEQLKLHRDEILAKMRKDYQKAGYTSLSITLANINKDIELLSGKPTSREEYVLPQEEQEKLDELLRMNS